MTNTDTDRLSSLRNHYKKWMTAERLYNESGLDISQDCAWRPSECEAVFLLRILEEKEREIRRLQTQVNQKGAI